MQTHSSRSVHRTTHLPADVTRAIAAVAPRSAVWAENLVYLLAVSAAFAVVMYVALLSMGH